MPTMPVGYRQADSVNRVHASGIDVVELLFRAVLMLVDWLVRSVNRSREARLWELPVRRAAVLP